MHARLLAIGLIILLTPAATHAATKPNIVIIMADDMGYSDASCYGGEIHTPNLDALAKNGVRFSRFYNTARCWSSRAALLTGYYAQQVRRDVIPGVKGTGGQANRPSWARLLPEMLKPLGYRSYHSGKWHVDGEVLKGGFDHSYSLNDHDRHFYPKWHTEDDQPLPAVDPSSGNYYSSTAVADYAIKYLKDHAKNHADTPFFTYVAFTTPHFPVQAPPEDIAKYKQTYLPGWDALRDARFKRQRALGLAGSELSAIERDLGPPYPFPEAIKKLGPNEVNRPKPWSELNDDQKAFQVAKMAVHAAMVDRMDQEIGRIINQLREMKTLDNTLILFMSDNGASAEMMVRGDGHDPNAAPGSGGSYLSIGPGWSSLANTPFRRHKTWVHEGGIATPLIAHWPSGIKAKDQIRDEACHLIDIVPTILEVTGAPEIKTWEGEPVPAAPGRSLAKHFETSSPVHTDDGIWWLHEGNRALLVNGLKLVAAKDQPWELYDMTTDRSEATNLASERPEKVKELAAIWNRQLQEFKAQATKGLPAETNSQPKKKAK